LKTENSDDELLVSRIQVEHLTIEWAAEKVITVHEIARTDTKPHKKRAPFYYGYFVSFRVISWIV
jgi:hypothetical protein